MGHLQVCTDTDTHTHITVYIYVHTRTYCTHTHTQESKRLCTYIHTSLDKFLVFNQILHLAQFKKGVDYTGNKLAVFMCSVLPVLGEGREEERGGVVERRSQCGAAHFTSYSTKQTSRNWLDR